MTKRKPGNSRGPLPGHGGRPRKRSNLRTLSRVKAETVEQANALAAHWKCTQGEAVERAIYDSFSTF